MLLNGYLLAAFLLWTLHLLHIDIYVSDGKKLYSRGTLCMTRNKNNYEGWGESFTILCNERLLILCEVLLFCCVWCVCLVVERDIFGLFW